MNWKVWLLLTIVASGLTVAGDDVEPSGGVRREVLLEKAPARKVVGQLTEAHPEAEFVFHPTLNGFFCIGSEKDVESIITEAVGLDTVPEIPPPPYYPLLPPPTPADLEEVKRLLSKLLDAGVPDPVPPEPVVQKPEVRVCADVRLVEVSNFENLEIFWLSTPVYIFDDAQTAGCEKLALPLGVFLAINNGPVLNLGPQELASSRIDTQTNTRVSVDFDDRLYRIDDRGMIGPVDVGFGLRIKAERCSDGYIDFEFQAEFKSVSNWEGHHPPTLLQHRTIGSASVRQGDSFFIGLPVQSGDFEASKRVPELNDLPRLGAFFRDPEAASRVFFVVTPRAER